jgi:DNA-binding response OmpR family regulator
MSGDEGKKRVLVIEDEKDMADIVAIFLRKEGYEVECAYDGEKGLDKIRSLKPDLVILDIMLPKLDGRDLLKTVRQEADIKDTPILVLSAKSQQWDRDIGLELGADEYLEKPFDGLRLVRQVRNILRRQ